MTILYAEFETRNFTFRCAVPSSRPDVGPPGQDAARKRIHAALRQGIRWHCRQTGADEETLLALLEEGNYNLYALEEAVVYRDSWPLGPPGANQLAPGKESLKS